VAAMAAAFLGSLPLLGLIGAVAALAKRSTARSPRALSRSCSTARAAAGRRVAPRLSCANPRRSGRVAEGGALLRRYGGECLHRGFESLLLRFAARRGVRVA